MTLRYAIAGTGRCGTGWMARMLTLHGARCGHEQIFDHSRTNTLRRLSEDSWWYGDASLAAAAYLRDMPPIAVLHLVRDPIAVVRSFSALDLKTPYGGFMVSQIPAMADAKDDLGRAIRWVHHWTNHILSSVPGQYRMEHLEDLAIDSARFAELMPWLGCLAPKEIEMIGEANTHVRDRNQGIKWKDVLAHPDGGLLVATAEQTGYVIV